MATIMTLGRLISVRNYLDGIKQVKANPDMMFKVSIGGKPMTGAAILSDVIHRDIHKRINARGNLKPLPVRVFCLPDRIIHIPNRHQRRKDQAVLTLLDEQAQ